MINWDKYANVTFSNASVLPGKLQRIIRQQGGYRRGERMQISKVQDRDAYRLYTVVASKLMDASLGDLPIEF